MPSTFRSPTYNEESSSGDTEEEFQDVEMADQATLESILARLNALEEENNKLRANSKRPKAKLPDPEKFSGKDLTLFPQFLSKLQAKNPY